LLDDDSFIEMADRNEAVDEILLILEESQSDYVDPYTVLGISEEDASKSLRVIKTSRSKFCLS